MCLSRAYAVKNGEKGLLAEDITSVEFRDGKILLKTLLGNEKEIEANIRQIDFLAHTITLENLKE